MSEKKSSEKQGSQKSVTEQGERRRIRLFAWLGPMLERRASKVEQVDKNEFDESDEKK